MAALAMPSSSHCSPQTFPDTFHDFFSKLPDVPDEDCLLEEKSLHIRKSVDRRWPSTRRSLRRRPDNMSFLSSGVGPGTGTSYGKPVLSPQPSRRRSCSIAVTRPPPDLNRFLQAEQQRGWRSPSPSGSGAKSPRAAMHQPLAFDSYSRTRTASMPVVSRHRPMLAQTKRPDDGMEYYRLRSFSITPNGIFNLGDSFKSRRSRSITSVTSTDSSITDCSNRDRLSSNASNGSNYTALEKSCTTPTYRVAILGSQGVGKTTLTHQFTTSEYICAYDTSLDDEFGQKTVSVMVDGKETELEIIDHPSSEMSVESFCSTYNPDVFVVVYSVVDRKSIKIAEEILLFLWKTDYIGTKGVILVGNKADLERKRQVPTSVGRKIASSCGCKFIETSSGLDHNVDELLVGILAQVQLNARRDRVCHGRSCSLRRGRRILKHILGFAHKSRSCENLLVL